MQKTAIRDSQQAPTPPAQPQGSTREPMRAHYPFGASLPAEPLGELIISGSSLYNPELAYRTAVVCGWSYAESTEMMRQQLPYYGLEDYVVRDVSVCNGAMLIVAKAYFVRSQDGKVGVLCFRGTVPDNLLNWMTDANTQLKSFAGGLVHVGFYENLQPLWGQLAKMLDAAVTGQDHPGRLEHLVLTGHSLGGAMAVLAAAKIASDPTFEACHERLRGVYTFGQPAVGDCAFAESCAQSFRLYRHVYRYDVVPHMPPSSTGKFVHFGDEYVGRPGQPWQRNVPPVIGLARYLVPAVAASALSYVFRRVVGLRALRFRYSIEDHGPEGYIQTSRASRAG